MPRSDTRRHQSEIGGEKERLACDFLQERGLRMLVPNFRCRHGEIDLVMREADTLVFVEVRFRTSTRFGTPAETVDVRKQRRLTAAAKYYLQQNPNNLACRFDVIAICGADNIDWIRNAFNAE